MGCPHQSLNTGKLKLALIGYGKMGQRVEKIAEERGHALTSIEEASICIDFTHPDAVLDNIHRLAAQKKSLVIGTTGWYDSLPQVKAWVEKYQIGLLYSPNFSIGIKLFMEVVEEAARRYLSRPGYEVAGLELHHSQKKDSPSGTALSIQKRIEQQAGRTVPFSAVRCGSIPGTHSVFFDSPVDQITLTHEARSRDGFALGAVQGAEWLNGKTGLFTMEDFIL